MFLTVVFTATLATPSLAPTNPIAVQRSGDYVVLLHGLGRTARSMRRLERTLQKEGYRVVNVTYPSTHSTVETLANDWLSGLLKREVVDRTVRVHFVTHSMGGIVLRQYLDGHRIDNLGRVVMLAPPSQGSELADSLQRHLLFQWFTGPAGQQLGARECSVPRTLGPVTFELGIIAGDRSANPWFSAQIPGPDDGKVSVASTKLEGMRDFLVVHSTHTWIMRRKEVIRSVTTFLRSGHFALSQTG
jgi:pimeloyl-ACP methyl ester carboxylesterase